MLGGVIAAVLVAVAVGARGTGVAETLVSRR